jgi:competence protein ComEA
VRIAPTSALLAFALERWRVLAAGTLFLAAATTAGLLLWPRPAPPIAVSTVTPRPSASPLPTLVVHVVGEVTVPGVYYLPTGARVTDAVELAGGLAESADPASLNLAARLIDGQQVVVRARGASPEPSLAGGSATSGGKLNLNRASASELDTLPGLGPALSGRIVDRRQRLGPFQSVEQLRDERLVPTATYDRIKDLLIVD